MSPEDISQRKAFMSQLWIMDGQMEVMVTVSTEPVTSFPQALATLLSFKLCDCSLAQSHVSRVREKGFPAVFVGLTRRNS